MRKPGLGRGLSALMDEVAAAQAPGGSSPTTLPIARIAANAGQPRRHFEPGALAELTASIRERGVLQPILVRPVGDDRYEIVAGERRWRAAQAAGLHELPVVVREFDDRATFEIAIIENVQRADLNVVEEAEGYLRLIRDHGYGHEDIAAVIGKSRSHVSNLLRLLELPDGILDMVVEGRLSMGHARAIIGRVDAIELSGRAASEGWSVRRLEDAVRKAAGKAPPKAIAPDSTQHRSGSRDPNLVALEAAMAEALGVRVSVLPGEGGDGTVSVAYSNLDQLDLICQRLLGPNGRFE